MVIHPDIPSKFRGPNVKPVVPDVSKEWPGLPKGVKFDPSDEELLWHLLAETGKGVAKRHPFINEFIVSLDEDDGLGNVHPQFLPGVKLDGSVSYFFHRKIEMDSSRKLKRQKKQDNSFEIFWHSIDKLNLVCVDGIHQGSKEVLSLCMKVNGRNPVKTPWLMHRYHISINGAEEDLVVSKIFYEIRAEVVGVATPLQVAPEFHGRLHVEPFYADASTQVFATLIPAELTVEELSEGFLTEGLWFASEYAVDHGIGRETNIEHVGDFKSAISQKYPTTYLEKARISLDKLSEGTTGTNEPSMLESSCETAAEISIFNTSAKFEISVKDQKECMVEKRNDGFLGSLGDSGNNSKYGKVIDDNCDYNDAHISMEKSCPERVLEHDHQKNMVDKMFKTQSRFIDTISGEINKTSICSFASHLSRDKHEAHVLLSSISSAKHSVAHENTINDLFILGLPAYSLNGKPSGKTEPKIAFEKNSNYWKNISVQSALPTKIEPKSFEETEIGVVPEKLFNNRLNASASSGLLVKVKNEPFEEAGASIILEKYVDKLPNFSQLSRPVNSSSTVNFCSSTANIQKKSIPHLYISKEGIQSCNLSHQTCVPEDLRFPSAESLSTMISSLDDVLSETTGLINQHPDKDDNVHDDLLMNNDNSQVIRDTDSFNRSFYPQRNVPAVKPQSNVKSESVESNFLNFSQIPPCNTREHVSLAFENKRVLYSDSPIDILDHVPLKYRLGISVSEGDVNARSWNILEEIAPVTPGYRSFGSVNTKERLSSCRRKRKKTVTDSVEKAMEEDAPGLLKVLLGRGIKVEEIKLYGDLEDNDPLETSSESSFEELETVMTKLFFERSSLLRFTLGRPVRASRAVYCLACLISLIEQTRYLRFRQTPVDWGWCRELQSFIFVFQAHNRIVLERPEYGYATYFFELVDSLPIDWQIQRLVKAMKLSNCSRTILLENKPLIVGEDLTESEALVLEAYGWTRNTGFGTLLNYCDRVVHDRRNVLHSSEWRAKIGKLLMSGYTGGRMVLANIPEKVVEYLGSRNSEIKTEL